MNNNKLVLEMCVCARKASLLFFYPCILYKRLLYMCVCVCECVALKNELTTTIFNFFKKKVYSYYVLLILLLTEFLREEKYK
jgi:hypothetical protein